jgi:hypothetical protein
MRAAQLGPTKQRGLTSITVTRRARRSMVEDRQLAQVLLSRVKIQQNPDPLVAAKAPSSRGLERSQVVAGSLA